MIDARRFAIKIGYATEGSAATLTDYDWRRTIEAEPNSLNHRLVYADWLEERDMHCAAEAQRLLMLGQLRCEQGICSLYLEKLPEPIQEWLRTRIDRGIPEASHINCAATYHVEAHVQQACFELHEEARPDVVVENASP